MAGSLTHAQASAFEDDRICVLVSAAAGFVLRLQRLRNRTATHGSLCGVRQESATSSVKQREVGTTSSAAFWKLSVSAAWSSAFNDRPSGQGGQASTRDKSIGISVVISVAARTAASSENGKRLFQIHEVMQMQIPSAGSA